MTSQEKALRDFAQFAGTRADCGEVAVAKPVLSCFRSDGAGEVSFDCTLYLKSWRWKGVSTKERINILIQAKERIRRADRVLLSSTVCVNYFTSSDRQMQLLQAFHYDYDPAQKGHPLFHMQVTNRCIALSAGTARCSKCICRRQCLQASCAARGYQPAT
jgi:hypothetical protein